jgi:hypothetical protein
MTDPNCSLCGRFAIGFCDACRQPVCTFHTGADANVDPSWNGDWQRLIDQKTDRRTYPAAMRQRAAEALRRDQRLTHLACRIESAVALVEAGERYSVPDTVDIARRALALGKPFDCEVWEFAFYVKKLFQPGGFRKVRPLYSVWTLASGTKSMGPESSAGTWALFLAENGRLYYWSIFGGPGNGPHIVSDRDLKPATSAYGEYDDLLRAFATTIS